MSGNPFEHEQEDLVGQQINRIESMRRDFGKLWDRIDKMIPGRYGALAKTELERGFQWAKQGIERPEN